MTGSWKLVDHQEPKRPDEPCICGAPAVLYDVSLEPLCRTCADACKYAPDEGEMIH